MSDILSREFFTKVLLHPSFVDLAAIDKHDAGQRTRISELETQLAEAQNSCARKDVEIEVTTVNMRAWREAANAQTDHVIELKAELAKVRKERGQARVERDRLSRHWIWRHESAERLGSQVVELTAELYALKAKLDEAGKELNEAQKLWRCFHCGFETSDKKLAAAHFGDVDDAEEFKPICRWWANMSADERGDALQDVCLQLNQEKAENDQLRAKLDEAGKDTERLNFLERLGLSTVRNGRGDGPVSDPGIHSWREIASGKWRWTAAWISSEFREIRKAIDAAIDAARGTK